MFCTEAPTAGARGSVVATAIMWTTIAFFGGHEAEGQARGLFRSHEPTRIAAMVGPDVDPETLRSRSVRVDVAQLDGVRELVSRGAPGSLTLNLFEDAVHSAVIERTAPAFSGGYTLSGPIVDAEMGSVVLVVNGGVVAGSVWTPEGTWEVHPAGSGMHIIEEVVPMAAIGECESPDPALEAAPFGVARFAPDRSVAATSDVTVADGSRIDIIAYYTAAAKDAMGGTEGVKAKIESHITTTNGILENGGALPRLHLVHLAQTDYTQGSEGVHGGFSDWVTAGTGGETVQWEEAEADVLVLFYNGGGGAAGGNFATMGIHNSSTFAHETGHLLGAQHDRYARCSVANRCSWDTGYDYGVPPFGYGYVNTERKWYTLMSYSSECWSKGLSCSLLHKFSNPDQTHSGVPLGVEGELYTNTPPGPSDVIRTINNMAKFLANFLPNVANCGSASYAFSPSSKSVSADGGSFTFEVTAADGCPWTATALGSHLAITDGMFSVGSRSVGYAVERSVLSTARSGSIRINFLTAPHRRGGNIHRRATALTISQEAAPSVPPVTVGRLPDLELRVEDGSRTIDVVDAFYDQNEDTLDYAATSSSPDVATAGVSGSRVTLRPIGVGSTTVSVAATDTGDANETAQQDFGVSVLAPRGATVSPHALTIPEGARGDYAVVLNSKPSGPVTVTPSVPANTDLSVDPTELEFTTGNWRIPQSVFVEAETDADTVADAPVTISHQVSGGDYGAVRVSSVRVTIVETDTSTLFVEAAAAPESGGTVAFQVELSTSSGADVTVEYVTSDGSGPAGARAGSDYTAASGRLTFSAGSTAAQQIVVDLTDDSEDEEEEETFRLTLHNVRHASLAGGGSTLQVTGTIRDDDDPEVEVSFGSANYGVTEGGTVTVVVRLNRDPERELSIDLDRTHHGGVTEEDYSGVPLQVAFGPGVRTQGFLFAAPDDSADDDGEAVVLSFGFLPPRVTGSGETTLAIRDNDGSGGPGPGGSGGGGGGPPPPEDGDDDDEDDGGGAGSGGGQPPPSGPPKADFTLTAECPGNLCRARTGLAVTFEDTSTGGVLSRRWDFGAGTGSRNRRIDHAWSSPGFYEVTLSVSDGTTTSTASEVFLVEASDRAGTCVSDADTLCLQDSRYAVGVEWWTADGGRGPGSVVQSGTNDSGVFTFFNRDNWEILIKVLDGCAVNGHVWVYGASTTDLGYAIRVTDTVTGAVQEYRNELGLSAPAITDVTAFSSGCSSSAGAIPRSGSGRGDTTAGNARAVVRIVTPPTPAGTPGPGTGSR